MKLLGKDGVSEVVGTILLLAIAIATFSVFAIYVMSSTSPSVSSPDLNLVGYINEEQHIVIEHKGGESVKLENIKITVWKGEVDSCMYHFDSNGHLMGENAVFNDSNSNKKWDVGEYIEIDATAVFGNITNWQISAIVVDGESNSIIFSGILQPGILRTVPPIPSFTYEPSNPKVGRGIIFNASASYDPDGGNIQRYIWDFKDGATEIKFDPIVTHQYSSAGVYYVTLTVVDDEGEQSSVTAGIGVGASIPPVNVTVNQPPVAFFINITQENGWVYFDASGSYDPDGTVVKYIWDFGDGHTQIKLYDPTIKWQYAKGGTTYNVSLVVEDNDGATSSKVSSYTLYHTLLYVPPIPPIAIIKTPADISTASAAFFSAADSYDPDGDALVNFSWDFNGDGIADAYGVNVTYHFYQVGNYTINLTVVDSSGGIGNASRVIYVRAPIAARRFLIVDNTPVYTQSGSLRPYRSHNWEGIDNIIKSLNIGDVYDYGKAIDDAYFYAYHNDTGWHNSTINPNGPYDPVNINDTIMAKYDIVIWSTGDYPGDGKWWGSGPKPSNPYLPNAWTTPMTEGYDDYANHMLELKNLMAKGGVFLLAGTYAVRDLQDYWGNWASQDEIDFGNELGLVEPTGGIDESLHTYNTIAYFADDAYNPDLNPYYTYFRYGPIYAQGVLHGIANTSSGGANLTIEQPMPLYSLIKQSSSDFKYSLQSASSQSPVLLDENFESQPQGWTHGGAKDEWEWGVPTFGPSGAHSGSKVYGTDLDSYYENNANCWLMTPQIDLTGYSQATLEFYDWYYIVYDWWYGYDHVYLEITDDGGTTWHQLADFHGSQQAWTHHSYDLSSYVGKIIQIRWRLYSDSGWRSYGYYLDDVKITATTSGIPSGYYAIDAVRGDNRSIVLGFDLNSPAINDTDRERYIINVVNWLAEAVGYPTTIYVDNNKPQSWYDDTHVGNIQDAIDRVMVGGTIYVNGTTIPYTSFNVIKSVNIIGIDTGNGYPIIRSNGEYAVKMGVDWITLRNFKIESMGNLQKGIYLDGSSSTSIINCNISHATYGIYAVSSNYLTIQNNRLFNNTYNIYVERCVKGEIKNNHIYSADYGIYAKNSPKLLIEANKIYRNDVKAIYIDSSDSILIQNNSLYENSIAIYTYSGGSLSIYINCISNNSKGIHLEQSTNTQVHDNDIIGNTQIGVLLANYSNGGNIFENTIKRNENGIKIMNSNYITLYNNTLSDNTNSIKIDKGNNNVIIQNDIKNSSYGIHVSSAISNQFHKNSIWNCSYGIYANAIMDSKIMENAINASENAITLYSSHPSKGNNSITLNTIYNCEYGILLSSSSNENKIFNNTIFNISNWGISIQSFSISNEVKNNTIVGSPYGIYIKSSSYNNISFNNISSPSIAIYLFSSDDNYLSNNSVTADYYGIYITLGSNNNKIVNSMINNSLYGIYVSSSYSTNISYNTIMNSTDGILVEDSDTAIIFHNIITNNQNGIHLISSSKNTIELNEIYINEINGIYLENSKSGTYGNNQINRNRIYDNGGNGIYLFSSRGNVIQDNQIYANEYGILTNSSDDNTIDSNELYSNTNIGLYLISSNGNKINNNSISFNEIGMYLYGSSQGDQYKISGNMIWNNTVGIFLNSSDSNYFGYDQVNVIWNNSYGIYMISSSSNYFSSNIIRNNTCGFFIASSNNYFSSNIISNNSYGLYLSLATGIEINGNKIDNNTIGVYINNSSTDNTIAGNDFILNDPSQYGVYIEGVLCKDNKIYLNNFINVTSISRSLGYDSGGGNSWYNINSIEKRGNYWGNYIYRYPNATMLPENNSWYWSIPYEIDGDAGEEDIHPLIARD